MTSDQRKKLSEIKQFKQLIAYLRDEMGWPINSESEFDELTYEYTTTELGIDDKSAAQIQEIKRLRPLSAKQPWGVFFVKFEPKKLPVVALRRILGQVALKKRASANPADRTMWAQEDLLFISNYGEGDDRQITLAHFSVPTGGHTLPSLKVLGWDSKDTVLHLDAVARELTEQLSWPNDESNVDAWRAKWRAAFTVGHQEVITTSKALSIRLAQLARDIRDRISTALTIETDDGPLTKLMKAFQESLIHDLTPNDFADMYAQTIAYGLLSSRIADPKKRSIDDLAAHMRLSPFLKELMETFLQVGGRHKSKGLDFDELGVGDVIDLLDQANMEAVVADFGDRNPQEDPVIHFYELFLEEYDAQKRKDRGVYYTPRPVVSYIVRSVHEILRTDFGLTDGLADTATWGEIAKRNKGIRIPEQVSPEDDFIRILDPATGTGTFLVEVIDCIHKTLVAKWKKLRKSDAEIEALWNEYVPDHLLPRLHGYELFMAPYAIAHLKVGLKLHETKYQFKSDKRARVFLTNSLIDAANQGDQLSYSLPALANESQEVNRVKTEGAFTVVVGNPPYARDSSNRGAFAESLVLRYKERVRSETNLQPLSDDYLKFLGLAHRQTDLSGCGVIGFITNSSYLTGLIHRGVREELYLDFSKINIFDLHGGMRDQYVGIDENVFAIRQGVAISILSKVAGSDRQASVAYGGMRGKQQEKFTRLNVEDITTSDLVNVPVEAPHFSFSRTLSGTAAQEYATFVPIDSWFGFQIAGYKTHRDHIAIDTIKDNLVVRLTDFASSKSDINLRMEYDIKDNGDWELPQARKALRDIDFIGQISMTSYRPFDDRWTLWGPVLMDRPRPEMGQLFTEGNFALVVKRQNAIVPFSYAFVVDKIFECCIFEGTHGNVMSFPLFSKQDGFFSEGETSNFRSEVLSEVARLCSIVHSDTGDETDENTFSSLDLFAYIYGLLHSNSYRARYAEHLLQGFPRVPMPREKTSFRALSELGKELIALHLQRDQSNTSSGIKFSGERLIEKPRWANGLVVIDKAGNSCFEGISLSVWEFQIGGYQVCEKWLKDRKGSVLTDADLLHYKRLVATIGKTLEVMQAIDKHIEQRGGWEASLKANE
jgi:type I restriction-modification system DNA methylase subunit